MCNQLVRVYTNGTLDIYKKCNIHVLTYIPILGKNHTNQFLLWKDS